MKNAFPYILGATLSTISSSAEAVAHPISLVREANQFSQVDPQKLCENQAILIARELLPHLRARVGSALRESLDSIEVKFRPDPNWPLQYVQSQVAYYLDGAKEENETGKFSLDFPNPFIDFSLRYWKKGEYMLSANCKFPEKK